ncbi:hypothetical protein CRUP_004787 [Coryphaenoides rupestris]|nr:hypothetical protein CRUP_004787 [Coryphaenoides rupestris]
MELELELGGIFVLNNTFDYDDYVNEEDCAPAVFLPFLCSLALILGIPGLLLLLTLLVRKRRHWSVMDVLALHLAVADGLMLVTLPFWSAQASQPRGWTFGTLFCKMCGAVFNINFYCGIFLLAGFSLERYLSIFRSTHFFSHRKPWLVQACCLSVWLLSLLLSIPDWVFLEDVKTTGDGGLECVHHLPPPTSEGGVDWGLASRLLYHTAGFLLPSAILVFCCSCFLLRLWRGPPLDPRKQRALCVILALVGVFLLCWTPYNLTLLAHTIQRAKQRPEAAGSSNSGSACGKPSSALGKGLRLTFALGCFHACLHPLLYFGLCQNVRKAVLQMLGCVPAGVEEDDARHSLWEFGVGEEALPQQNPEEKVALNQTTATGQQVEEPSQC